MTVGSPRASPAPGRWRLGVAISNEVPVAESVALARDAEALGFAELWVPESSHGRSVTSVVAAIAGVTARIGLGVGIVNPFWRHPSLIAMEAATLDEIAGGRLRLGLGAAIWTLRALGEDDERTARPVSATVEALRIVRAMLRGRRGPEPELFRTRPEGRLDFVPVRRDLPLYVGAVNARMLAQSGAWADGAYLGAITSPGYTRWASERVAAGARAAGRDPASLDLVANVLDSVARDRTAARRAVRPVLAYYLNRVEAVVVEAAGADPDAVAAVRRAVGEQGVDGALGVVSEDLIDTFAAAGTPDDVTEALGRYRAAGLNAPLAWHVHGPDPSEGLRLLAGAALAVPAQ